MIKHPMQMLIPALLLLTACAPQVTTPEPEANLRPYELAPLPMEDRWIIAVPDFSVEAGSVRVARTDLSNEGESFYRELGAGVADVFLTEAFRSQRFRITERSDLAAVIREQDLAQSGRIDPSTAANVGRVTGAEIIVLGSLSQLGVTTSGGGGRVLGVLGGGAETVTAQATVDIRMVDANTAEILAIGHASSEVSERHVELDVAGILRSLRAGRSGTTAIDLAVRNAIRAAIEDAAEGLPAKR